MRMVQTVSFLLLGATLGAQTPTKSVDELRAFFAENCVKCHGSDGSAHDDQLLDCVHKARLLSYRQCDVRQRTDRHQCDLSRL